MIYRQLYLSINVELHHINLYMNIRKYYENNWKTYKKIRSQ